MNQNLAADGSLFSSSCPGDGSWNGRSSTLGGAGLRCCVLLAALVLLISARSKAAGPVVLNEILASNINAVEVAGAYPDFAELYNATEQPVSLAGVTLVDSSLASVPLAFPATLVLGPGERLVVWCDRDLTLPEPQARFGLGASTDRLRLTGPDGSVWDEVTFGLQAPDLSIGRVPEGTGEWQLNQPTPGAINVSQALGQPVELFINEWMASPDQGDDWLELFNQGSLPVALSGLILTDSTSFPAGNRPIPALSFIGPGGFVQFFASDLEETDADHLDFRLSSSSEIVTLLASDGVTVLEQIEYGEQSDDTSQGRTPDGGEDIASFPGPQATPGASNVRELTSVVISEVLTHTDPPLEDAIELHNTTASAVDISHWWLSDAAGTPQKFRIPPGTVLSPGGYIVFYEFQFNSGLNGFSLNSYEGDDVWLSEGDANGQLTGGTTFVRFGPLKNGVSAGRVPISSGFDFAPLSRRTFGEDAPVSLPQFRMGRGLTNAGPAIHAVNFSEFFFRPAPLNVSQPAGEPFIELHNASSAAVPLFHPEFPTNPWRIRGPVDFDFPPGVQLEADGRLLITAFSPETDLQRAAAFRQAWSIPDNVRILGPFSGVLDDWENGLELQEPDAPEGPDKPRPGFVPHVRVERIDFADVPPWPSIPASSGLSLQRGDPAAFSNDPASWMAAQPSPGHATAPGGGDRDGDGMPDDWESANGLNPDLAADALEDADSDGLINRDEYTAGTNPRDAADTLRLALERLSTTTLRLTFGVTAGHTYRLEAQPHPPGDAWQIVTNVPAQPAQGVFELSPLPMEGTQLFRLVVGEGP
jgi:hypothetical protein